MSTKNTGHHETEIDEASSPPSSPPHLPARPKVSEILRIRQVGDNEPELLVHWSNRNSPDWVTGSALANSDAISTEDLQNFLETHEIEFLSLPGRLEESSAEQAENLRSLSNESSALAEGSEVAGKIPGGEKPAEVTVEPHVDATSTKQGADGVLGDGVTSDDAGAVGGCASAMPASSGDDATKEGRALDDSVAQGGGVDEVGLMGDSANLQASASETGELDGTGKGVASAVPESSGQALGEVVTEGKTAGGEGAGAHVETEPGEQVHESLVWATATLQEISLLSSYWELAYAGADVSPDCELLFFQISKGCL